MGKKGDQRGKQRTFGQSVEAISTKRSNHLLLKECRPQRISGEINLFCGIKATVNVPSIRGDMKHSTNICQSRHMCSVCNDCMEKQSVVPQGEISQTSVEWLRVVIGILLAWKTKLDPCSEVLVKRGGVVRPPRHISPSLVLRPTRQIANEHHAALEKKPQITGLPPGLRVVDVCHVITASSWGPSVLFLISRNLSAVKMTPSQKQMFILKYFIDQKQANVPAF